MGFCFLPSVSAECFSAGVAPMRVIDSDTGKEVILDSTEGLNADLAAINQPCDHSRKELRQRRNRGGSIQYSEQCLRCGRSIGPFLKHSRELEQAPAWNAELEDKFHAARESQRAAIYQKHVRIQRGRTEGFWKQYNEYLQSDEWKQKRAKVLARAKHQCEVCGEKAATEIHHLHYKHVFAEFLFELVAVCDDCHQRLHADESDSENAEEDSDEGSFDGEYTVHPCCGCRHQSEQSDKMWCARFNVAVDAALSVQGSCGPNQDGFEPLR
jgi:ribosomal protein S14